MREKDQILPETWKPATIGELIGGNGIFVDGDWVESKDQDPDGNVRLIQLADIGDGDFRNKSSRFLTRTKAYELRCTFLQNDDILIARMPEPLGRACLFPLIGDEKHVTVVDVCIVRPGHNKISNKFLIYAINSPQVRRVIDNFKTGSTRKRISRKNLARVNLPIAPFPEQHRIVAKIELLFSELDKGVDELKKARETLALYRQSLLKAAFEGRLTEKWRKEHAGELESVDQLLARIKAEREKRYQQQVNEWNQSVKDWEAKGELGRKPTKPRKPKELPPLTEEELVDLPGLPEGWAWIRLGNCNVEVFDGPFGSNLKSSDYVASGVRVIRLENIGALKFYEEKRSYISEEKYATITKHTVSGGDVIFSSFIAEGTRVTVLPDYIDKAVNKADCFCVRTCDSFLDPSYIAAHLSTRLVFKLLESKIHGATRPRINTTQLKYCPLPICSEREQQKIIKEIRSIASVTEQIEETISQSLQQSELLRQSILKKAFSGKLVPQDPNDEPAAELLERLKAEREKAAKEKKLKRKTPQKREKRQMADLLTALKQAGDWISAQEAFRQCGISDGAETDRIEALYIELRDFVNAGKVSVERRGDEDWLKLQATQEAQGAP